MRLLRDGRPDPQRNRARVRDGRRARRSRDPRPIKTYSSWPTIPQLYVEGEFIGGCDIGANSTQRRIAREARCRGARTRRPTLHVSDRAAEFLKAATERAGESLHLAIGRVPDARYLGRTRPARSRARATASPSTRPGERAARRRHQDRLCRDGDGHDLAIDNPNAPAPVQAARGHGAEATARRGPAPALLRRADAEERATASIPGARLVDASVAAEIEKLPKDAMLVFHCHHGAQSAGRRALPQPRLPQRAQRGRRIDAWSRLVDRRFPATSGAHETRRGGRRGRADRGAIRAAVPDAQVQVKAGGAGTSR